MNDTKPYKSTGFGDIHGPKAYEFIGFGDNQPEDPPREALRGRRGPRLPEQVATEVGRMLT